MEGEEPHSHARQTAISAVAAFAKGKYMEASRTQDALNSKDGNASKTKEKKSKRKTSSRSLLKAKDLLLDKVLPQLAHDAELKAECAKFADKIFDKFVEEERSHLNHN